MSEFIIYLKWYFSVVLNFVQSNAIIDMDKMEVISFDSSSSSYRLLGQKVGNSFKDGAKLKKEKKLT